VEKRAAPAKQRLVTASQLKRVLQLNGRGVTGRRYASVAAASKASGVQVCNVVLHKRKGSSSEKFWSAVRAVQKACRG
jgi:signal transduction protein with GAF and PtsI domain